MAIGDVIARLSVSLGLETAAFERNARQASNSVGRMQATMSKSAGLITAAFTAGAIGGVLGNIAANAFEMASSLSEAAQQVGVSVEALQELRFAADQTGIGADKMDATIKRLNKSLGELQLGSKPAVAAFAAIGLSADELRGKSPEVALGIIADALNKLPDASQRVAIGQQLMGRSFSDLLPLINGGSKALKDYAQQSRDNGQISTEDAAKLDDLADSWDKLKTRVGVATANMIASTSKWLDETAERQQRFKASIDAFYASVGSAIRSIGKFVGDMATIGKNLVLGLARGIREAPGAVWDALKGVVAGAISRAKSLLGIQSPSRVFMEIGDYIGQGLAIGIEGSSGRVTAATKKMTEAARRAAEETAQLIDRLFPERLQAKQYDRDLQLIAGANLSKDDESNARFRLGREFTGSTGTVPVSLLDDPVANGERFQEAMQKVTEGLDSFKAKAGVTTVAVAKSFKDMADATIQSLGNLANAIKGGGFLGILQAVIGLGTQLGSIGAFGKTVAGRINAPKYANGTNFHPGGLAVVGERGPELVSMPRGSRVTPNGQWGGGQKLQVEVVANNNGFGAIVRNHAGQVVAEAAPALMDGGARVAQSRAAYRSTRRVA